ncbi:MAG: ABC transporter permease subunit [Anaerolineales bacterium]|jgi:NitT/TauT family transport system permease protein
MRRRFGPLVAPLSNLRPADGVVVLLLLALLAFGAHLASSAPAKIAGPTIRLDPSALPYYATLSFLRMLGAYVLSMIFSLGYGYAAARIPAAERLLMPVLDILQSVPILSYLPVVLLSLTVLLPEPLAVEISAVLLIFTSQAWNLTFSFYQALRTEPDELREASSIFRLGTWLRLRTLEVPFATGGLVWNSMMSWAGGWFFLMAAETFRVGERDFRLPGLGSYLQTAADQGNVPQVILGLATLVALIIALDQLVWRPLLVWADRFKLDTVEGEEAPESWFYDLLSRSRLVEFFSRRIWGPAAERVDTLLARPMVRPSKPRESRGGAWVWLALAGVVVVLLVLGGVQAFRLLLQLPLADLRRILLAALASLLRVGAAIGIAALWTVPAGVAIGSNKRLSDLLGPVVQVVASIPATALFPAILLIFLALPGGLNAAAILLMLLGTQWYVLFNVIAGASAIPQDLRYTTEILSLGRLQRWRTLILPSLFPYLITGLITASGGAWNASIVAEYVQFAGQTHRTLGLGALIAEATGRGDYALLLGSTLTMVLVVLLINRFVWRRLFRLAADRYRMD